MSNNNNNFSSGTSSSSRLDGIDIRLALEILGQRQTCNHDHTTGSSTNNNRDVSVPSDIRRTWGQEIQITNDNTVTDNVDENKEQQEEQDCTCSIISPLNMIQTCQLTTDENNNNNNSDENIIPMSINENNSNTDVLELNLEEQKNTINTIRTQRMKQIQEQLQSMSYKQLIHYILVTQQQRVQVYKDYDSGLETVLQTNNLTYYPTVVAEATANFAVLSDTINKIHTILSDMVDISTTITTTITVNEDGNSKEQPQPQQQHENYNTITEIIQLIKQLQLNERNKLNYTAAYHLECIRCNEQFGTSSSSSTTTTTIMSTEQTLFQQSMISLREKIHNCISNINDTIDEIKAILIDI